MDVDSDPFDQNLLLQFRCLGTTDKDDLIKQFINLTSTNLDEETATFLLEMSNWNLQAAIGSYFDYDIPRLPSMTIVNTGPSPDVKVAANSRYTASRTLCNNGDQYWPSGCSLSFVSGNHAASRDSIPIRMVAPNSNTEVNIECITPSEPGNYHSKWQMTMSCGTVFGETIWVMFTVDPSLSAIDEVDLSEMLNSNIFTAHPSLPSIDEINLSEQLNSSMTVVDHQNENENSSVGNRPFDLSEQLSSRMTLVDDDEGGCFDDDNAVLCQNSTENRLHRFLPDGY